MTCQYCKGNCRKAGKQRNGAQKRYCKGCKKYQQTSYKKKAYEVGINIQVKALVRVSIGIKDINCILHIAVTTMIRHVAKYMGRALAQADQSIDQAVKI